MNAGVHHVNGNIYSLKFPRQYPVCPSDIALASFE